VSRGVRWPYVTSRQILYSLDNNCVPSQLYSHRLCRPLTVFLRVNRAGPHGCQSGGGVIEGYWRVGMIEDRPERDRNVEAM
jgi:hypothetical protein